MTKSELRGELVTILVTASVRGKGGCLTRTEAGVAIDSMIASDKSEYWNGVRTDPDAPEAPSGLPRDAKVLLQRVVRIYRAM